MLTLSYPLPNSMPRSASTSEEGTYLADSRTGNHAESDPYGQVALNKLSRFWYRILGESFDSCCHSWIPYVLAPVTVHRFPCTHCCVALCRWLRCTNPPEWPLSTGGCRPVAVGLLVGVPQKLEELLLAPFGFSQPIEDPETVSAIEHEPQVLQVRREMARHSRLRCLTTGYHKRRVLRGAAGLVCVTCWHPLKP